MANKDIVSLEQNIEFLVDQRKLLEPYLQYLGQHLAQASKAEPLSIDKAFEIFKFITEYHTNATILIMKAGEVINAHRSRK